MKSSKSDDNFKKGTPKLHHSIHFDLPNILYFSGITGLAIGLGIVIGYYAGARSVRWLPTMLEVFLGICIASLMAIMAGRAVDGTAIKQTTKGKRLRKRIVLCIVLLSAVLLGKLGVYWTQQPSPLTELTPAEFNEIFAFDAECYKNYDKSVGDLITKLEDYAEKFGSKERMLTGDEEKLLRDIWGSLHDYSFAMDQIRSFYEDWYRFDPSRVQCSYHHRSFLLTFAAELSLYEKSTRFVKLVTEYPNVVKFLNTPSQEYSLPANSFRTFRQQLQGGRDNARVIAGAQFLLWMKTALNGKAVIKDAGCEWLWDKAELELALIDKFGNIERANLTASSDFDLIKETVDDIWFKSQKKVATIMGNTRIRRVGKYLITPAQQELMDTALEPGDIMISRKNWYLSNVGLPGFWPHAILYIGAPDKFNTYFDDDAVKEWVKQVSGEDINLSQHLEAKYPDKWAQYNLGNDGELYRVIEGVSPGIILNTFDGAFGDYMAAVRPRLDKLAKAKAIATAFSHLGKPYDYNFDFATDHALVCTELVWRSYRPANGKDGLDISLVKLAGRNTLPANEIAKLYAKEYGSDECQLEFVYFLDAIEAQARAIVSTEEEFRESCKRTKWSAALQ